VTDDLTMVLDRIKASLEHILTFTPFIMKGHKLKKTVASWMLIRRRLWILLVLLPLVVFLFLCRRSGHHDGPYQKNKIVLLSYVFGETAANKGFLHMFIESAKSSGVDVAIVGSPKPPFKLPPNVRHVHVTWDQLVDKVSSKLLKGRELKDLRHAHFYKVNDFKPLSAFLFPEIVDGYDWWGHVDNDLILGDIRHFITDELLDQYDVLSPLMFNNKQTYGPFTIYRNCKMMNELFRLAPRPMEDIFGRRYLWCFDEWGQGGQFNSSISAIINHHSKRLGIRKPTSPYIPFEWDGGCEDKPRCIECTLTIPPHGGPRPKLVLSPNNEELVLCHYQNSKNSIEKSLKDPTVRDRIIKGGVMRVSSPEGFRVPRLK
jgi:hypothetical protein